MTASPPALPGWMTLALWAARGVVAIVGVLWIVAAVSKLAEPYPAYEFAARVVGGGAPAKALVVAEVFVEGLLGLATLSAAAGTTALALGSLGWLGAATATLLRVDAAGGGAVACACLPAFVDDTVADAITRNYVLGGVLVAATIVSCVGDARRRAERSARQPALPE